MKKLSVVLMVMLFLVGTATAAFAVNYNEAVNSGAYTNTTAFSATELGTLKAVDDSVYDNGLKNANGSGIGVGGQATNTNVIKSQNMFGGTQRTHGEYQNNTNSCASCHQTHTAAGKSLLFKDGVYTTCTACHDGTLGFFDVFNKSTAGTFGGTKDGNASVHMANNTQKIQAAPGGYQAVDFASDTYKYVASGWKNDFNCASCHAPHGSHSDRLLHYNPNNMASTSTVTAVGAVYGDPAGKKKVNLTAYKGTLPNGPATGTYAFFIANNTEWDAATNLTNRTSSHADEHANAATNDYVFAVVYKTAATTWAVDNTPWIYGYKAHSNKFYQTTLKTSNALYETAADNSATLPQAAFGVDGVHYEFGVGFGYVDYEYTTAGGGALDISTISYGDVSPAYVVKFNFQATTFDFAGLTLKYVDDKTYDATGVGVKISTFCAACHTDYMVKSGTAAGTYTQAYRHTTNNDSYVCLKCHFAHGTDVTVMMDALDRDLTELQGAPYNMTLADAKAYLKDNNTSSALKRYTNMSVCWKCHTDSKATQLKNNTTYWENYDTTSPHGWTTNW